MDTNRSVAVFGRRYSVTIMVSNGAELESFVHATSLADALASEHIKIALGRIPTGIRSVAILVFEVGKK